MCKNKLRFIYKFIGKDYIENTENLISTNLQGSRHIPNVKLPKLEIKPFEGQPEKWHEFWDSFFLYIQLIKIYSMDWTDVYDTHNIEHRTEPVSH